MGSVRIAAYGCDVCRRAGRGGDSTRSSVCSTGVVGGLRQGWGVGVGVVSWMMLYLVAEYNVADASIATSVTDFLALSGLGKRIGSEEETSRVSSFLHVASARAMGETYTQLAHSLLSVPAISSIEPTVYALGRSLLAGLVGSWGSSAHPQLASYAGYP